MFDRQQNLALTKREYVFLMAGLIMMINQAKAAIDLEKLIPGLDPVPEDDELLDSDEELFIKEQKDNNKIPEELTNRYFETLNSSVLPF